MEKKQFDEEVEVEKRKISQLYREIKSGGDEDEKLKWLYKNPMEVVDREEYLLGRSVDKTLDFINGKDASASKEMSNIPKRLLMGDNRNYKEQVDAQKKVAEDPLYAIRQKEIDARKQLLNNPVKMKEIQMMLEAQSKKIKAAKKLRRKEKKSQNVDRLLLKQLKMMSKNVDIKSLVKNLDDDSDDDDSDVSEKKKGSKGKNKRRSRSSSESLESDSKEVRKKRRKKRKSSRRDSSSDSKEVVRKNKKKSRKCSESESDSEENTKSKHKRVKKRSSSSSSSEDSSDENTKRKYKKSKKRSSSESESDSAKSKRKKSKKRAPSDSESEDHSKKKHSKSRKRASSESEGDSSDSEDVSKHKRHARKKDKSASKSDSDEEGSSRNSRGRKKRKRSRKTQSGEQSSENGDSESDRVKKTLKCRGDGDRHRTRHEKKDENSTSHRKHSSSDKDRGGRRGDASRASSSRKFGLSMLDGSKPDFSKKEYTPYKKKDEKQKYIPQKPVHVSGKERDAEVKAMLDNAKWRKKEQEAEALRHKKEQRKDETIQDYDEDFMRKQVASLQSRGSMADRIKSKVNNIQRSRSSMSQNFVRK